MLLAAECMRSLTDAVLRFKMARRLCGRLLEQEQQKINGLQMSCSIELETPIPSNVVHPFQHMSISGIEGGMARGKRKLSHLSNFVNICFK